MAENVHFLRKSVQLRVGVMWW